LLLILKVLFTFATKQATLMRRSVVLRLPFHSVFHGKYPEQSKKEHKENLRAKFVRKTLVVLGSRKILTL
jgi:hypothetical protein